MMDLTYNSDKKKSFLHNGAAPSWTPWPVRNLHPVRETATGWITQCRGMVVDQQPNSQQTQICWNRLYK